MTDQPTAPGNLAQTPTVPPPGGWTAITAGVLACLGSAYRLLSVVVLIVAILLLSDLDMAGETDKARTLFLVSIPVFSIIGALLLVGGVQMFRKKSSARPLIAIGAAIEIAYSVIELVAVEAIADADDSYYVIGSPLVVALAIVFPVATIILTLTAPTARWLDYHATPAQSDASVPTQRSKAPWIAGGAVGVVVLVLGALLLAGAASLGSSGTYSYDSIDDSCDLVDVSVLRTWAAAPRNAPEHREDKDGPTLGARLACNASYSTSGVYSTSSASLRMSADITGSLDDGPAFDSWKSVDSTTGSATSELSGLGERAYYAVRRLSKSDLEVKVVAVDDNLTVSVQITVHGSSLPSENELRAACRHQVELAMQRMPT
ncbi:hypothetical protein AB4305_30965 [Nocardia sp. 2YAB30]|uniref:hypothetical protein n=1 Tax=Nocardia sp. 2YAB30 TaxID=3233022 RepID=UPI003F9D7079